MLSADATPDIGAYETSSSYLVTSAADSLNTGTLRSAILWADSNPGTVVSPTNVIDFDTTGTFSTPQTITLSANLGTLALTNSTAPVEIIGPGPGIVTVSGNGAVGVFSVAQGAIVTMENLTIAQGSANSGAGIANSGNLTITGDDFVGNASVYYGGAIYNSGGVLNVSNTTFTNNTATYGQGGAIDNDRTTVVFTGTLAQGLPSVTGVHSGTQGLTVGQTVAGPGVPAGTTILAIATNGSTGTRTLTLSANATATGSESLTAISAGTLTVTNSSFTGGFAFQGGAINNKYGTMTVTGSNITNNTATEGGGIFNNAIASVTNSTIANNIAHDGGGIANDLTGVGKLYLANSTVAGNSGGNNGGGINSAGIVTIVNSTIAYNSVIPGGPGGGIDVTSGTTTIYNTIVADNTAGTGSTATPNDVSGTLAPASVNNLIGSAGGGLTNGVNNNIVKPAVIGLGTLGNYGGPLQTVPLLSTSPAIDAGANSITGLTIPTLDERGALRGPAGLNAGANVDIGAYEASSSYLVTSTADANVAGTLRAALSWANLSSNANPINVKTPAPNTILFDTTNAFSAPQTIILSSGPLALTNTTTPVAITGSSTIPITISAGGISGVLTVGANVSATVSYLTFANGSATVVTGPSNGGGIDNAGKLTVMNSTLTNNTAIDGGGIANELTGNLTLLGSTIAGNSATTGGGIFNAGTLSMTNSTIASNGAYSGGGIFNAGTMTAVNSTIAYNGIFFGGIGGGLETTTTTAALYNTIVASNNVGTLSGQVASDINGTVATSSAYNLIGTGGSGGLTNGINGNQVLVSPATAGLGTLASNGGPTQTIALLAASPGQAASPAIGKGSAKITGVAVPTTDQRGVARPSTSVDIGAFQLSTASSSSPGSPATTVSSPTKGSGTGSTKLTVSTPPKASSTGSTKLVVGPSGSKPSGGSAAKLHAATKSHAVTKPHAAAKPKVVHRAAVVKKAVKAVKHRA